jgi:Methyltransferase domain
MIAQCLECGAKFEDEYRSTICPHETFPTNDGNNNFTIHESAYLSSEKQSGEQFDSDYFLHGKQTGKSLYENYRWLPKLTVPMAARIVSHCGIRSHHSILDFGCARGYLVRALRYELGYNAWGHDISQWALENCDPLVKDYLIANNSAIFDRSFDWIIAKDVLEHVDDVCSAMALLKTAGVGILVIVPIAHGREYDVPEYEEDVTHIHRHPLSWWMGHLCQAGWSVEGRYHIDGIKENYKQYPTGNGFIVARRIDG